jgi:hypothetical protein
MAILMPPQKSTIKPEDVQSRLARYVFSCERPKIDAAKSQEKRQEEARRGQLFWVTASGFLKLREIPGGIRSELTARTPETTFRMSPATKVTADIRNFGDKLLVTAAITIPGISGRPNSEKTIDVTHAIEQSIDSTPGKRQML